MTQVTFYLAAHAAFALALLASAAFRIVGKDGSLADWGNDALYIGLVFVLVLTMGMPLVG